MLFEEDGQRIGRDRLKLEIVKRDRERAIFLQRDQDPAEPRHLGLLDQAVAQLGWLHLGRGGQGGLQAAMLLDQLGGRLRTDPADAGNVIDRIPHQRQDIADQLGRHAELFLHFGHTDANVLHRIEHVDTGFAALAMPARADQLHQVLVGRNDGYVPAALGRGAGIGGDQVIGFQPLLLDARQAEGAGGIADQRELRLQVLGRRRSVGLVLIVDLVAKALATGVQDHRQVGWAIGFVQIIGQLPQHGRVAIDRADRHALRVGQRRQAVIGAEDIGRSVDQVEMLLGLHGGTLAAAGPAR